MRIYCLLICAGLFGQAVPPKLPTRPSDPREFENLTASRNERLPPGWQVKADFGATHQLQKLTKRAKPARPVPGQTPSGESRVLDANWRGLWQSRVLADGARLWRVSIRSPGAGGLRLHFDGIDLGERTLWIYPPKAVRTPVSVLGPFTGKGPHEDGEFWSGTIFGDTAVLEVLEPAGAATGAPNLHFDRLLHLYPNFNGEADAGAPKADNGPVPRPAAAPAAAVEELAGTANPSAVITAAACEVDATCYPKYNSLAAGTLHYQFISDGYSYVCSGSLVTTRSGAGKPYVATANHCISADAEARSVEAYFGYASTTCNAPSVLRENAYRVSGARYLAGGGWSSGDYTLLLLNAAPPPGSTFLGWNPTDMPFNQNFVGLHHPKGSWRRVAVGSRTPDAPANVEGEAAPANLFYQMAYSLGLTEQGSSGSAIMTEAGQIFGTLSYGRAVPPNASICSYSSQNSAYGRFSAAYPAYRPYLEDEAAPGLSLSNTNLAFTIDGGVFSGPASFNVTLSSTSNTPAAFATTLSAPWLQVRASANQVSSTAPATLTVTMDPNYFTVAGAQAGTIRVASGTLVPLTINVSANIVFRDSRVTLSVNPNPVTQADPDADGYTFFYTIRVSEGTGTATTLTSLSIGGVDYSANIAAWFGSTALAGNGTTQVNLRGRNITVPSQVPFVLGGIDPTSRKAWSRTLSVPFQAKPAVSSLLLTSQPPQVQQDPTSTDCAWPHDIVVSEGGGYPVKITKFIAAGYDLSKEIGDYFDSADIPARGSTIAGICWTGVTAPSNLDFEIQGVDSVGRTVVVKNSIRFVGPLADPVRLTVPGSEVSFSTIRNSTAPLTPVQLPITFGRAGTPWTARLVFGQSQSAWLTAGPLSGSGSAILSLAPALAGVTAGTYTASIYVESAATLPQSIRIPITFRVLETRAAPVLAANSVAHNASYKGALTPGALAAVFGANLGIGSDIAVRLPLPSVLGATQVRVNGRVAPLLYAGAGQVNFQVPWETEIGNATLVVDVGGQTAQTTFPVTQVNPGIYTSDGRLLVPANAAARSSVILAFVTGVGSVSPTVATGNAPDFSVPVANLPTPRGGVTASIGGVAARVLFAAIPYGLVGILQANIEVPAGAPIGSQPLVISVGGVASPPAFLTVRYYTRACIP